MNALRVVQIACTDAFAGIERYVTTLANGLAQSGCHVTVLGGHEQRMRRELTAEVCGWRPARDVREAFTQLVRVGRADIVHAHMTHAELAATLSRPITGGHLVVTRHFAAPRGSTRGGALAAVAIRRVVELQLAPSRFVAAHADGPCQVVWPGVPTAGAAIPASAREPVVLVLQRLEPQKDTATALHAWARSGVHELGWKLDIVGDGRERPSLERLADELSIAESCRFLGHSDEVGGQLDRASIMLATAPAEPFGLSVVEAMSAALPVVATASGGHLETVGACPEAILFAPGDADAAAAQLRALAGDESLRAAYGLQLRELQRTRFTAERQVAETLALYETLVNP